jgi:hypothetical protein
MTDNSPSAATPSSAGGVSVWYFIAATFAFAAPALLFSGADLWLRVVLLAVGLALMVAGGIQLRTEIAARRRADSPDSTDTAPEDSR